MLTKIKYVGPLGGVITGSGHELTRGKACDCDEETANQLVKERPQHFELASGDSTTDGGAD